MLYKIGESEVFYYEARNRKTGLTQVFAIARKPDGTEVAYSPLVELDGGLNPLSEGIYKVTIPFDQDGKWLIMFDALDAGHRRPTIEKVIVDTSLKNAILLLPDTLSTQHGPGSWETTPTEGAETVGGAFKPGEIS